jgi:hypothetical protein
MDADRRRRAQDGRRRPLLPQSARTIQQPTDRLCRRGSGLGIAGRPAHLRSMMQHDLALAFAHDAAPTADQLDRAVAAYLTRFTGSSREHARSDLRCFLTWCADRQLHPLAARRPHLELYIRWMQEIRHFKPSTVSRRFSVVAGFYRTAVIDAVLDLSPAEHVRRPAVPPADPRVHAPAIRSTAHCQPRVR